MNPAPSGPSLRAIASLTGYSVATVSMALRDMARVPESTRSAIKSAAQKMGYVRDERMASALQQARRRKPPTPDTIAFVSELPHEQLSLSSWLTSLFHASTHAANFLGYELSAVVIDRDPSSQRKLSRTLYSRGIQGILLAPITTWYPARVDLQWSRFAAVEIGTTLSGSALHGVERNYYLDCLDLYQWLYDQNRRKIGFVLSKERTAYLRRVPEATLLLFQQSHPDVSFSNPPEYELTISRDSFLRWYEKEKPDVLITYRDNFQPWLSAAGYRVPQDVGLVFLDSNGRNETGLVSDIELLAKTATRLVANMVRRGEFGLPKRRCTLSFRNIFVRGKTLTKKCLSA